MELIFVFVGKARQAYLEEGVTDYLGRIRRYLRAEVRYVRTEPRRAGAKAKALTLEAKRIAVELKGVDYLICLDRLGKQLSSEELAHHIDALILKGVKRIGFVIGGAEGLSGEVACVAHFVLSLGPMTFTHEMSRLILLEQVYRALTIRAGEPYHK